MTTQHKRIIYSAFFAFTLSACGGGDGGDGGTTGISYTGVTSQASLTISNGEEISTSSYQNGSSGQGLGTVLSSLSEVEPGQQKNSPKTATLTKTLAGAINKIQLSTDVSAISRAVQTERESITGDCGGTANLIISIDDVSGDFSGSFTFSDYCDLGDVMNGGLSMSGNIDVNNLTFGPVAMTMTSLTISTDDDSFTVDGTMSMDIENNPIVTTMNMKLKDNATQEVFWVENFRMTIVENFSYEEISMEGRAYHPEYGYVDITTPTPFRYTGSDEYPYPGVMVATGANSGTSTLTSLSNTSYQIDIDEDGDGNLEQTTTGNWSSL